MWIEHFGGSRLWKFPVLKLYLFLLCSLFSVTLGNTRISHFSNFMFWSIFNKKHQEHGLGFWLWVDHLETWLPFQTAKSWLYKVLSNIQLDTIESNIAKSIFFVFVIGRGFERRLWWWSLHHRGKRASLFLLPWNCKSWTWTWWPCYSMTNPHEGNPSSPGRVAMLVPAEEESKVMLMIHWWWLIRLIQDDAKMAT